MWRSYIGEYDGWVELIGESDFALRQPPANIPVLDVLWDFLLNAADKNVVAAASEFLIAVHQKISFIMGDQKSTVTRGFVESCMSKLEGASSDAHGDVVSLRCLQLLEKLVNEHDKAGSAGLRAHSQRLRGELLTLDIANNLVARPVGTQAKFQIKLYVGMGVARRLVAVANCRHNTHTRTTLAAFKTRRCGSYGTRFRCKRRCRSTRRGCSWAPMSC